MYINTLIVKFKKQIPQWEIPLFRGAIIEAASDCNCLLFHNHQGDGFRYGYPLIQYKCIRGQASLVCVGEGVEEIGAFFRNMLLLMPVVLLFRNSIHDKKKTSILVARLVEFRQVCRTA